MFLLSIFLLPSLILAQIIPHWFAFLSSRMQTTLLIVAGIVHFLLILSPYNENWGFSDSEQMGLFGYAPPMLAFGLAFVAIPIYLYMTSVPGEGLDCTYDKDCNTGLICNHGYNPPRCKKLGSAGSRCSINEDCEKGQVCNRSLQPPKCTKPLVGDRCMSDADCGSGMVCNQGFQPPECQQPGDVGYVCAESADCRPELRCYIPKSVCARPDDL